MIQCIRIVKCCGVIDAWLAKYQNKVLIAGAWSLFCETFSMCTQWRMKFLKPNIKKHLQLWSVFMVSLSACSHAVLFGYDFRLCAILKFFLCHLWKNGTLPTAFPRIEKYGMNNTGTMLLWKHTWDWSYYTTFDFSATIQSLNKCTRLKEWCYITNNLHSFNNASTFLTSCSVKYQL